MAAAEVPDNKFFRDNTKQPGHNKSISNKEDTFMNCHKFNNSIECTVHQCANHCSDCNYCSLDKIKVGTHESNPSVDQCTDCLSFERK